MLRLRFSRRRWDEHGAVAVMVALCSIVVFVVAAFAVDLGNGFARKRQVHNQADFAALAGAALLPGPAADPAFNDEAVKEAAKYLLSNQPPDDSGQAYTYDELRTVITDGNTANGQAYYGHFSGATLLRDPNELTIVTPPRLVQYGLAKVIGASNATVKASATVGIYSPKASIFPAYAVAGCDQGPQTITDPASGHVADTVPSLASATDANIVDLDTPTVSSPNPTPSQVAVNPGLATLIINGNNKIAQATKVGFFKEGSPAPAPTTVLSGTDIGHPTSTSLSVTLPAGGIPGLTDAEGLWWIRVWAPTSNNGPDFQWSAIQRNGNALNTLPFRVGTPYLRCAGTSNQGNYGTLKLPRSTNPSTWLPMNIAQGLEPPLTLRTYPGTMASNLAQPLCMDTTTSPTVYSTTTGTPTRLPFTNCVDTDTGLPANATTDGLITGAGARLNVNTKSGCDPTGGSAKRRLGTSSYYINNEVLSCYFMNNSVSVGDVSQDTYTGPRLISADIYSSPRFFWQPVLGIRPNSGGSEHYKVIDMRPAFIGEQALTGTKAVPQATSDNGITWENNAVASVSVVFLNADAIEIPKGGAVMNWLGGTSPKLVRMTH